MYNFTTAFDVLFLLRSRYRSVDLRYAGDVVQIIVNTDTESKILGEGPTFEDVATLVAKKINTAVIVLD